MFITYVFRPANLSRFFWFKWGPESRSLLFFSQQFSEFLVGFHPFLRGSNRAWGHVFRHMVPPKKSHGSLTHTFQYSNGATRPFITFPWHMPGWFGSEAPGRRNGGAPFKWDAQSRGVTCWAWGSLLPGWPCGVHGKVAGVPSCWGFRTTPKWMVYKGKSYENPNLKWMI